MSEIIYQTDNKTFGQIVEDTIRIKLANVRVDGATAAVALGVSYSTFRRWCEHKLIKGTGNPVKYSLPDLLFIDQNEIRMKYRMLNK